MDITLPVWIASIAITVFVLHAIKDTLWSVYYACVWRGSVSVLDQIIPKHQRVMFIDILIKYITTLINEYIQRESLRNVKADLDQLRSYQHVLHTPDQSQLMHIMDELMAKCHTNPDGVAQYQAPMSHSKYARRTPGTLKRGPNTLPEWTDAEDLPDQIIDDDINNPYIHRPRIQLRSW